MISLYLHVKEFIWPQLTLDLGYNNTCYTCCINKYSSKRVKANDIHSCLRKNPRPMTYHNMTKKYISINPRTRINKMCSPAAKKIVKSLFAPHLCSKVLTKSSHPCIALQRMSTLLFSQATRNKIQSIWLYNMMLVLVRK